MDRVTYDELCRSAGIERVLASRLAQRVLRWFGHMERIGMASRVLMKEVEGGYGVDRGWIGWMV